MQVRDHPEGYRQQDWLKISISYTMHLKDNDTERFAAMRLACVNVVSTKGHHAGAS